MAVIIGTEGDDTLNGTADPDTITGLGGNDLLNGGLGADAMDGGAGNDTFYVESFSDLVIEASGGGFDRVAASATYQLAAAAEIELFEAITQSSTNSFDLVGNDTSQRIVGNDGNNLINAGGGDDVLVGLGGNDTLIGSPGTDTMYGGTGDDIYFVESAGDRVFESIGEGTDRVASSVNYALDITSWVETLETTQLAGTGAINLTGSYYTRLLIGNEGANVLQSFGGGETYAGGGNDTIIGSDQARSLYGGTGNDVYFVYDFADQIVDYVGDGNDRVAANADYALDSSAEVETLEFIQLGGTIGYSLIGNQYAQTIIGNDGDNGISGKEGADVLVGRGGADRFGFDTALGAGNVDRIEDFVSGQDRIYLDDAIFTAIAPGALQAGSFWAGTQANDADDRIIYDQTSGALFYDSDGNGATAQVQFAVLTGAPPINTSDVIVF